MRKIIKVFLIFSICFFTAAASAFTSPAAKVAAAEYDQDYQEAVADISMLANLMIQDFNNTGKHYLIISNNYFNVFDHLSVWVDVPGLYLPGSATYESFTELTANSQFIEYYEVADYFAQENDIDFGIFNIVENFVFLSIWVAMDCPQPQNFRTFS